MRLTVLAVGFSRGTTEGTLTDDYIHRAVQMGRNMGFPAIAVEEVAVSKARDAKTRMAEEVVTIDLEGRSSLCDAIVVASGRSTRHVSSIAEHLARRLKDAGYGTRPMNGIAQGDWALVDAGDVIVHIFRPEVRAYYNLEGMWSVDEPKRSRVK